MANLLGRLARPKVTLQLLNRAATLATIVAPPPHAFTAPYSVSCPTQLFQAFLSPRLTPGGMFIALPTSFRFSAMETRSSVRGRDIALPIRCTD